MIRNHLTSEVKRRRALSWGALLAAFFAVVSPLTASDADPTKAFLGCLKMEGENPLVPLQPDDKPQPARTSIVLMCEGPPAEGLFDALELIASQEVLPGIVERRSDTGIYCVRVASPSPRYNWSIGINVGGPFVDAIK